MRTRRAFLLVVLLVAVSQFFPTAHAKLIGDWMANGTAVDSSTLHNDGTFNGIYAPGRLGAGQAFDLASGKVHVRDIPAYTFRNYPGWSIGFWFNTNGTASDSPQVFIAQDVSTQSFPKWWIGWGDVTNAFDVHLNDYNCNGCAFLPSQPVNLPKGWNQFTVVKVPGAFAFYLNGESIGTKPYAGIIPDPPVDLIFGFAEGCCSVASQYAGLLDDIVIYDTALSPAEVKALVPEPSFVIVLAVGLALLTAQRIVRLFNGEQ